MLASLLKVRLLLVALVLVLALAPVAPALAQDGGDGDLPDGGEVIVEEPAEESSAVLGWLDDLLSFVPSVLGLAGVGGIVGAVLDIIKLTGKLKPGQALRIQLIINFIIWSALRISGQLGHEQETLEVIATLGVALPALLQLFGMFGGAKLAHKFMKLLDAQAFSAKAHAAGKA